MTGILTEEIHHSTTDAQSGGLTGSQEGLCGVAACTELGQKIVDL